MQVVRFCRLKASVGRDSIVTFEDARGDALQRPVKDAGLARVQSVVRAVLQTEPVVQRCKHLLHEPPPLSGGTGGFKSMICPTAKAEYFPQRGLTRGVRKRASDLPVGQSGRKEIVVEFSQREDDRR
jgi:hypothetical protein